MVFASTLLFVGNTAACSLTDPTARRSLGCSIGYLAAMDDFLGVLRPEWDAVRAAVRPLEDAYDHAGDDRLAAIEAEIRHNLAPLIPINPAASVVVASLLIDAVKTSDAKERRALQLEIVTALAPATDGGSLSGVVILIAMFTAPYGFPADLPDATAACWQTAFREFEVLDERNKLPPSDERLWKGRACIAPTMEALRN